MCGPARIQSPGSSTPSGCLVSRPECRGPVTASRADWPNASGAALALCCSATRNATPPWPHQCIGDGNGGKGWVGEKGHSRTVREYACRPRALPMQPRGAPWRQLSKERRPPGSSRSGGANQGWPPTHGHHRMGAGHSGGGDAGLKRKGRLPRRTWQSLSLLVSSLALLLSSLTFWFTLSAYFFRSSIWSFDFWPYCFREDTCSRAAWRQPVDVRNICTPWQALH